MRGSEEYRGKMRFKSVGTATEDYLIRGVVKKLEVN
jgi:hypothetical protein